MHSYKVSNQAKSLMVTMTAAGIVLTLEGVICRRYERHFYNSGAVPFWMLLTL